MIINKINLWLIIEVAILIVFTFTFVVATYRIWLHPLSKYPGPKYLAVSDIFSAWRSFIKMDMTHYATELHRKYGTIVRIGPNRLIMDSTICWPEVYNARSTSDKDEFGKIPELMFPNDHLALLGAIREDHRRQRRQLNHAFSTTALQEQEAIIMQYIDKFINNLTVFAQEQKVLNIATWFNYTTFDIIGDLLFADSFHCLDGSTTYVDNFFYGLIGSIYRRFLLNYPMLKPFIALYTGPEHLQRAIIGAKENFLLGRLKCQARMAMGAEPKDGRRDIATYMLRTSDDPTQYLTEQELYNTSSALVIAGSETTATGLSGFTFLLGTHPEKKKILVDEIRAAFTSESQITITSTARLQYLHAAIEETLRIYPPSPQPPPRVSPGAQVDGQWIPRGTKIQVIPPSTYRNPDNFIDPDSFEPERWLNSDHPLYNSRFAYDKRHLVKSFSTGSRDCLGKNLAYAELRTIMCRLLYRFDVELMPGQEQWMNSQLSGAIWIKSPLLVRLK